MTKTIRGFGLLMAAGVVFTALLSGCSSQGSDREPDVGSLSLPLAANAPSGARYRLRDATFEIWSNYGYSYEDGGYNSAAAVGVGGSGGGSYGTYVTVSSEDVDADASSLLVDLEQGWYYVSLYPGWRFEKVQGSTVTDPHVEATLLSQQTVRVHVSPHSTTWAQYAFGIGDSALWLNGKLNVDINVYENPNEYYGVGGGGEGGYGSAGSGDYGPGGGSPGYDGSTGGGG
ncbi:hypothetical protein [Sorangium sp. So ce1000]|uniref:hypothetical protein n=1 Tax=Sorangium sp. So ce1000 TaxID=3133325 RepID=UPI003F6143E4